MTGLRILIIGSGGREHTLAWALSRSKNIGQIYVAPGNAGTEWKEGTESDGARQASSSNVAIDITDTQALIDFSCRNMIDLVVVGPEAPLASGIVDAFKDAGLRIFGPEQAAAKLEASKVFAKKFMRLHGIPTAEFTVFENYEAASQYASNIKYPVVIKADGLAAGKGVMICETPEETHEALRLMMVEGVFGEAGRHVVVEECLSGWEVSVLAFMDGKSFAVMPYTADHKRAFDGDHGPNTGGMGAYAPVEIGYPNFDRVLSEQILCPVLDGIAQQGAAYIGVLYVGLMMTANGPYVLEFNCRFGDPETQVILPLLDSDLAEILIACTEEKLNPSTVRWKDKACATVVLASGGYPGEYQVGLPITGLEKVSELSDVHIFHAGTTRRESGVITSGGRVLAVSGLGESRSTALERAYGAVETIQFDGVHYRRDIGSTAREAM